MPHTRPPTLHAPARVTRSSSCRPVVLLPTGRWSDVSSTFVKQETAKKPDIDAEGLAEALVKRAIRFRTQDNVAVVCVDLRPKAKGGSGA